MTHGDKAKAKSAKAIKASGSSKTHDGQGSKAGKAVQTAGSKKAGAETLQQKGSTKAESGAGAKGSGPKGRAEAETDGFTNPIIAASFKHAIKKYPVAFRRLTD